MGIYNVDEMLRGMSARQFAAWQAYDALETFSRRRLDYLFASIVQTLWNINRDVKKHPTAFKLDEFVLDFEEKAPKKPLTNEQVKEKMMLLTSMFTGVSLKQMPK
jgi:hypothetical protein